MCKREGITTERLRTALNDADDAKAAKRLMVTLAYIDGGAVMTLAERYGNPLSTIWNWLECFENQPVADALEDEPRPGRPPKLSTEHRAEVETGMDGSPRDIYYDAEEGTVEHLRDLVQDTFDVECTEAQIHWLFSLNRTCFF